MADEPAFGEGLPEDENEEEAAKPAGPSTARRVAGQAAQKAAGKTLEKAASVLPVGRAAVIAKNVLGFLKSPRFLVIQLVWLLAIVVIALIAFAFIRYPFAPKPLGGTAVTPAIAVGNTTDMDNLRLADCLNEERKDLEEKDGPLPDKCVKLLEGSTDKPGALAKTKENLEKSAKLAQEQLGNGEAKTKALAELAAMKKELDAINPRSNYKELRPRVLAYALALERYRQSLPGIVLDVPSDSQVGGTDCGRTSVGMVVNYNLKKKNQPTKTYDKICPTTSLFSHLTSELGKIDGPEYSDFAGGPNSAGYIENIKQSIDKGHPVIWMTGLSASGFGHFVVLTGYRTDGAGTITTFLANDPNARNQPQKNTDSLISPTGNKVQLTPDNMKQYATHKNASGPGRPGTGYFYVR